MKFFACKADDITSVAFGDATIATQTDLSKTGSVDLKLGIRSADIRIVQAKGPNTTTAQVQRVKDLGNHKLVTADFDEFVIKVKVERGIEVPAEHVELVLPGENCCVYADNVLFKLSKRGLNFSNAKSHFSC